MHLFFLEKQPTYLPGTLNFNHTRMETNSKERHGSFICATRMFISSTTTRVCKEAPTSLKQTERPSPLQSSVKTFTESPALISHEELPMSQRHARLKAPSF